MNKTIIYNLEKYGLAKIYQLHENGYKVLCPVCNSELLFLKESQSDGKRPGIYCPVRENHVGISLITGRQKLWDKLDRMEEERIQ